MTMLHPTVRHRADARRLADTEDIRLALVLNGGVSLAVWMGGVTHELDLLRRASRDDLKGVSAADRKIFRKWRELAEQKHAKVTVDIVAGTSAGGLNGMLLATAIGRGAGLPDLRAMWQKSASLDELLKEGRRNSVLNGDAFKQALHEAVTGITDGKDAARHRKSGGHPITLFMTATALGGRPRSFKDAFDDSFDVRDHRRLYRFRQDTTARKYLAADDGTWAVRKQPEDDFTDACTDALVEAARATASFPVAFPAVNERTMMKYRRQPKPFLLDPASHVMDGGVLNNAPFGPVLEEITRRPLNSPLKRVVVYVVPSVGRVGREGTGSQEGDATPSWLETGLNAIQYPREADFRSGTSDLSSRLAASLRSSRPELFRRMTEEHGLTKVLLDAAGGLLGEYRRSRTIGVLWHIRKLLADADTVTCLIAPAESDPKEIDEIAGMDPPWIPRRDAETELGDARRGWNWGLIPATRVLDTLCSHLYDLAQSADDTQHRRVLMHSAATVSERLHDSLAIEEAVTKRLWARHPRGTELSDRSASRLLNAVYTDLNVGEELGRLIREAGESYVSARVQVGLGRLPFDPVTACLAMEVVTEAYAPPPKITQPVTPPFTFLRLGPDRMSPLFDEDLYADLGDRKLYGIRFNHFGAFMNAEWRRSDFIWGRLDAAHHMLSLLVTDARERRVQEAELHRLILEAELAGHMTANRRSTGFPGLIRRTTLASPSADGEAAPSDWMRRHLDELTGADRKLLEQVLHSPEGQETLRAAVNSVHRLLINPSPRATGTSVNRLWHKCLDYTRPVFAHRAGDLQAGQNKPWLRRATWYVRRRVRFACTHDPTTLPEELNKAVRRTAIGAAALLTLFGAALGGFLGHRSDRRRHQVRGSGVGPTVRRIRSGRH